MNRREFIFGVAGAVAADVMRNIDAAELPPVKWNDTRHGAYFTAYHSLNKKYLEEAKRLAGDLFLTSCVVDIKTDDGEVFVETDHPFYRRKGVRVRMPVTLDTFADEMHRLGVRVIGRMVVFKDPILGKDPAHAVTDSGGGLWTGESNWANPFDEEVHRYNHAVAAAGLARGLDGIQFDYIRCPAGKRRANAAFSGKNGKTTFDAINGFLKGARAHLDKELSMDCFGELMLHRSGSDEIIGQNLATMGKHLDVISPMVYPSHFYPGNFGFSNPGAHPYEVIRRSVGKTREFLKENDASSTVRPWLQCFSTHTPSFGASYIRDQLRGAQDAGASEVLWWNAKCDYSTIKRSLRS